MATYFFESGCNFFFFLPSPVARGILVPQPGIKPVPPALEAQSLNHWTAREVPGCDYFWKNVKSDGTVLLIRWMISWVQDWESNKALLCVLQTNYRSNSLEILQKYFDLWYKPLELVYSKGHPFEGKIPI